MSWRSLLCNSQECNCTASELSKKESYLGKRGSANANRSFPINEGNKQNTTMYKRMALPR